MLYWLFGDITHINSRFFNFSHQQLTSFEDTGAVVFDFKNGGAGSFNFSTAAWDQNLESSITILAEKGTVKVSGQYMNAVEYCHIMDYRLPQDLSNDDASLNNTTMLDAMVNAVRNNGSSNASEGAKAVDMIERIYMAGQQNTKTGS